MNSHYIQYLYSQCTQGRTLSCCFMLFLYRISIFLNWFAKELFPDVALQLWEGGEQSRLEKVPCEVLVQHVPGGGVRIRQIRYRWETMNRYSFIHILQNISWHKPRTRSCSYFSSHQILLVRRHTYLDVGKYTSVGRSLRYPPVTLQIPNWRNLTLSCHGGILIIWVE